MRSNLILLTTILLVGCAGSNEGMGAGEGDASMTGELVSTLDVKVHPEGVRLGLHVTNTTGEAVEFTFPSSQRYEFVVRDGTGEEVWRWSEGMMFTQALSHATLAPGESWDMSALWEPGSRTGRFVATGRLTARSHEVEQSAEFELP